LAAIHDLIDQVPDARLRERLKAEWAKTAQDKKFGLVFEDHLPELLVMDTAVPKVGDLVCLRGESLKTPWMVHRIESGVATCVSLSEVPESRDLETKTLVVVKQFGEPIFPALVPIDAVQNAAPDAPWHTLIEADNYHALQLLEYLYAGQVDCIYIDPPYNTGARDWKYNNDYVDANDSWRHSKWLAFMERRLRLAKNLLRPDNGVLIVTIDEHEVHHLRMLLESVFPEARTQMVTIVNNAAGVSQGAFYRVEEYAFFVFLGTSKPIPGSDDYLSEQQESTTNQFWFSLIRYGGINALPSKRANLVYPIAIDPESLEIIGTGPSLQARLDAGENFGNLDTWKPDRDELGKLPRVWPYRGNGSLSTWQLNETTLMDLYQRGFVRVRRQKGGPGENQFSISYVKSGNREKVEKGEIPILGRERPNGPLVLGQTSRSVVGKTVWKRAKHDAGKWGSRFLRETLGEVNFDYAKSPYAVLDCLDSAVGDRKHALIVDFFSGSGTTLVATEMLNKRDDGQRRCILVTNNEVSAEEAERLRQQGYQPGEAAWESQGICRSVTWPRSKFTILGRRDDGTPLPGDYLTGRSLEREKPRNFTWLGFLDPALLDTVAKKKQLVALILGLPQNLVTEEGFVVSGDHSVSVLFDPEKSEGWLTALEDQAHITDFYVVSTTKKQFESLKADISDLLGPVVTTEEERRLLAQGFEANLAYFKLGFLDKNQVALRRAFDELLPLLWLRAGGRGARPEISGKKTPSNWFVPEGNPFVVLLDEAQMSDLLTQLTGRTGLTHLFVVTDSDESFKSLAREARAVLGASNPQLEAVQLYRDYLRNFAINQEVGASQ